MSGSKSVAVSGGGGGDGYRAPFTAVQWQELEHQALIYKYLVAGVPVPSDLVMPIRRSFEALSARLFHHPTLGYCSYYGKKFDPEPGRCRRTDGKKWRCSKDAYHESKYCERHMHRGRNRSRKPVESQSTSQSLSTAMSNIGTVNSTGSVKRSFQNVSNASSPSQSLYPITNSESFDFGSNASETQVDTSSYVINNKDLRYAQGLTVNLDDHNYTSGVPENARGLGMDINIDGSRRLMPSQLSTNSLLKPQNDSYLQSNSLQLNMTNTFDPLVDTTSMSKQRQQHPFFGSEIGSPGGQVKHEQSMRQFFDEWPKAKEPWSNLDATTQLSMSMDPEFNARNPCPPNDA
ncbi:growth-regulating factor 5-like isoform X2 [Cynara cardunculus var. scolymus]|nr:growth-regulating factor 5-like isoform X2 [Cynara cardunculus var. scolymus]